MHLNMEPLYKAHMIRKTLDEGIKYLSYTNNHNLSGVYTLKHSISTLSLRHKEPFATASSSILISYCDFRLSQPASSSRPSPPEI